MSDADFPAEDAIKGDDAATSPASPSKHRMKCGFAMLILAALLWAPLPLLPFLPLSAGAKVALGGVLFVAVQIAWWGGTALVGPIMVQRIYAAFRSFWRRRKL